MSRPLLNTPLAILAGSLIISAAIVVSWRTQLKQNACTALSHSLEVTFGNGTYPVVENYLKKEPGHENVWYIETAEAVHGVTLAQCAQR